MLFLILGGIIGFCLGVYTDCKHGSSFSPMLTATGLVYGFIIMVIVGAIMTFSLSNSKTTEEYKLSPIYLSDTDDEIYLSSTSFNQNTAYNYVIQSIEGNCIQTEISDNIRITYIAENTVPTVKIYNKQAEAKDWYVLFGFPIG